MRVMPSSPAVATRVPSGDQATALTSQVCPVSAVRAWPVVGLQMRAVPSKPAVARRVPSGDQASDRGHPSVCPVSWMR